MVAAAAAQGRTGAALGDPAGERLPGDAVALSHRARARIAGTRPRCRGLRPARRQPPRGPWRIAGGSPRPHLDVVGRVQRGCRHQSIGLGSAAAHRGGDRHAVARQPDDLVPVHEGDGGQQHRRHRLCGSAVLGRCSPRGGDRTRSLGVPAGRGLQPRHLADSGARPIARLPGARHRRRGCSTTRASESTMWSTSISTRASPRSCK